MEGKLSGRRPALVYGLAGLLLLVGAWLLLRPGAAAADAGYALEFDGINNRVELGDVSHLMGSSNWRDDKSISAWIRPSGAAPLQKPPTSGQLIVAADRPRVFGISRAVYEGGDRLWVWNVDASGLDAIGIEFSLDEWVHVTLVHSGGRLYAYRNGSLVGSVASGTTAGTAPNNGTLYLGGSARDDPSLSFAGQLDEVRGWARALEGETIAGWYDQSVQTAHPQWSELRGYYQMTDGAGTILSDNGPYGNDGLLQEGMGDGSWVFSEAPIDGSGPLPSVTPGLSPTVTASVTPTEEVLTATAAATATPSPTATEEVPTATAAATATPSPTATEEVPTATAAATATPSATATEEVPTATPSGGLPLEVGALDTGGEAYTVRLANNLAYLADVTQGLRIIDVSDPRAPVERGSYETSRRIYWVDVAGSFAYAAATTAGVRVVDVSDPAQPVEVSAFGTAGYAWAVTLHENVAYVADRESGLRIVDVSNPAQPAELALLPLPGEVLGIAIGGPYAYVAAYTGGLQVVDVSDPRLPQVVASLPTSRAYDLTVEGSFVYVADGGAGLQIVDISDPTNPVRAGRYDTGGWSRSVDLRGTIVYVGDWTGGVTMLDVANPNAPSLVGILTLPDRTRDVQVDGNYLYVADYESGLHIFDLGPP